MAGALAGKVTLVTGAGSGIGRESALLFAKEGAKLVIADVNADNGNSLVGEIAHAGGEAVFVQADISDEAQVERLIESAARAFGKLDYAFNNAGVGPSSQLIADSSTAEWRRVLGINLTGTYFCVKHEIAQMIKSGGGAIVNMSSIAGIKGVPAMAAYSASKHGVIGITRTAAAEYAKAGIRVNAVCPGVVDTPTNRAAGVDWNQVVPTPLGRIAQPSEIAELVVWLLSAKSSYVTGQAISIDGGMNATSFVLP